MNIFLKSFLHQKRCCQHSNEQTHIGCYLYSFVSLNIQIHVLSWYITVHPETEQPILKAFSLLGMWADFSNTLGRHNCN